MRLAWLPISLYLYFPVQLACKVYQPRTPATTVMWKYLSLA